MLDIYNLLNSDPVTNFNLNVTAPRTVIAVLDPRVFQLGFRFEFNSAPRKEPMNAKFAEDAKISKPLATFATSAFCL